MNPDLWRYTSGWNWKYIHSAPRASKFDGGRGSAKHRHARKLRAMARHA